MSFNQVSLPLWQPKLLWADGVWWQCDSCLLTNLIITQYSNNSMFNLCQTNVSFLYPENIRKHPVFWCCQRVYKCSIGWRCLKEDENNEALIHFMPLFPFHCVKSALIRSFLVRIFPHSDRIRIDTFYLSVYSPSTGKYWLGKLRIRTLFTLCLFHAFPLF